MAKASASGQAKTRLAPPLTLDEAALFNTAFLRDIADNLRAAGAQAPIKGLMAYGPPGTQDFFTAIHAGRDRADRMLVLRISAPASCTPSPRS